MTREQCREWRNLRVAPGCNAFEFGIAGLRFEENASLALDEGEGWFSHKIPSSPGPMVSDFVTHGAEFEYSTLGIHIGQDDRLTFFGGSGKEIVGEFVDCREGSPTLHKRVVASFAASPRRRLIIPRGVAHTFDNLRGVVTRDEPVWHSADDNPHWNVNNDLVSILREDARFPVVTVNDYRMPDDLHLYLTRLSQAVLGDPKAYSTRFRLKIGGVERYVMFQENAWNDEGRPLGPLLAACDGSPVDALRSNYAITGKASWTLVPNTGSAVCDVLRLPPGGAGDGGSDFFLHQRTRKWYTFLTGEGAGLRIDAVDLRPHSPGCGEVHGVETIADPRVSYRIEPGIAYRFRARVEHYLRSENEVFVAQDEPRGDLLPIGGDLAILSEAAISAGLPVLPDLPTLRCPDEVVRRMARFETGAG